ncbi:hypothetical protein RMI40_11435 [Pseudomonas protegens]|uniref:hypothetical protein n=1 Tax=Pseudomonas protegens TaxID=380021 RepID=UPI00287D9350|nr:hypothetical protein [Pseudomonas protegens]MDS9875460.1 hypothetical protein [Pseudomonas protegens]
MITPTSALIVVPLLSGRPQARQKQQATRNAWLKLYELWPGEPAEGRAVYRKRRVKRTFADHLQNKVFPAQNPGFIDSKVNPVPPRRRWLASEEAHPAITTLPADAFAGKPAPTKKTCAYLP